MFVHQTFDLSLCMIDDIDGGGSPTIIPLNSTIGPYGYFVVQVQGLLNNNGDEVRFLSHDGQLLDSTSYSGQTTSGNSRYRWPDGSYWSSIEDASPTIGYSNQNMGPEVQPRQHGSFEIRIFDVGQVV
jgi:hypothetical protein